MSLSNWTRNLLGRAKLGQLPDEQLYARTYASYHLAALRRGASVEEAAERLLAAEQRLIRNAEHYFDLVVLDKRDERVRLRDRRGQELEVIDLVTNSYNDLEWIEEPRRELARFVAEAPLSSCISRKIAGLHDTHDRLRTEFAEHMGYEACVLGTNGYISQLSTIFALLHQGDVIFSDQHNHSSLVDGCRLSHAKVITFPHRDYDRLEQLLARHRRGFNCAAILSDGVFSTKGAAADVDRINALARRHNAVSIIDDTHGVGVLGARGRGVIDRSATRPDVLTGGFGKAYGSFGGFALANRAIGAAIDILGRQNVNSSFMSPILAAQCLYNFRYHRDHHEELGAALAARLRAFNAALMEQGIACYPDPDRHIHPVFCLYHRSEKEALACFKAVLDAGFLPSYFPPPVAPYPSLRFSLHRNVKEEDLRRLAALLGKLGLTADPGGERAAPRAAAASVGEPAPAEAPASFDPRWSVAGLLANEQIYRYKTFYDVKALLTRYDERTDYCNYGYFRDGAATVNPSAELVRLCAERLGLGAEDVLLNVGSGSGQPDVDIAREHPVRRIVGVNICKEQVEHANAKAGSHGLGDRVSHRVMSAADVGSLAGEGVTRVICLESLAEMAEAGAVLRACMALLPPGGRLVMCDLTRGASGRVNPFQGLAGSALRTMTSPLFGDNWRPPEFYASALRAAGARQVTIESIGDKVYPDLCREAAARFPALDAAPHVPESAKVLARLLYASLETLHAWGQIDYVVISATK